MTRVQSQRTRQALLVVGPGPEEAPPPELLELYTLDGVAVDVGKDRTRARWRGTWVGTPTLPYEQNDFVLDEDNLWILSDISLLGDTDQPTSSTTGAWTLMTVGGGMKWLGEYDPDADYKNNSVVNHEGSVYISVGEIASGSAEPGAVPAPLSTTTVKAGDAMFGGHNQPARIMVKGQIVDPIPAQLGGEVNVGQDINDKYFKIAAIPGDQVVLQWHGGDISIFDGGSGDALFADPHPASGTPDGPDLTFVVPSLNATHGDIPAYVVVEVGGDVTDLLWVSEDDVGGWELIVEGATDEGPELPVGGDDGQLLAKASGTDFDVEWIDPPSGGGDLPPGGTDGQVLTKQSGTDGDADWEDSAGGGGGTTEAWRVVGAGGQPAFENGWGPGSPGLLKFRKRPDGVVELRGFVVVGSGSSMVTVFTLPVGYRITSTEEQMWFAVWGPSGPLKAEVWHDGTVKVTQAAYACLDTIRFSVD